MDFSTTTITIGLLAATMSGLSKTGLPGISLVGVVLMTMAVPEEAKKSVGLVLPLLLVGDLFAVTYYQRHTDWSIIRRLIPSVALGMGAGGLLLGRIDDQQFKVLLGGLVLGLLVLDAFRKRLGIDGLPRKWWFAAMLGALAGFTTVIGNAAGPVMAVYLIAVGLSKERFMGCAAWFFFLVNLSKVPIYGLQGAITQQTLLFDLCILPGMLTGALVGRPLLRAIPQRVFEPLVLLLAALGAMNLVGLYDFLFEWLPATTG